MLFYFAGVNCHAHMKKIQRWAELFHGPLPILLSYFHLRSELVRKKTNTLALYKEWYPGAKIMVDSGAYSFKAGRKTKSDPEDYFKEYLQWCLDNQHLYHRVVELDIDSVVGVEKVTEWRQEMMAQGVTPILCWNALRGEEAWNEYCRGDEYDYLSLGSMYVKAPKTGRMIRKAQAKGKKVHGMGVTTAAAMNKTPFYSIDSTTYLAGEVWGRIYVFVGSKLISIEADHKKDRARYRRYFESYGLDADKIISDSDYFEVTCANTLAWAMAMRRWEERFDRKHADLRADDYPQWAMLARAKVAKDVLDSTNNRYLLEAKTPEDQAVDVDPDDVQGWQFDVDTGVLSYVGKKVLVPTFPEAYKSVDGETVYFNMKQHAEKHLSPGEKARRTKARAKAAMGKVASADTESKAQEEEQATLPSVIPTVVIVWRESEGGTLQYTTYSPHTNTALKGIPRKAIVWLDSNEDVPQELIRELRKQEAQGEFRILRVDSTIPVNTPFFAAAAALAQGQESKSPLHRTVQETVLEMTGDKALDKPINGKEGSNNPSTSIQSPTPRNFGSTKQEKDPPTPVGSTRSLPGASNLPSTTGEPLAGIEAATAAGGGGHNVDDAGTGRLPVPTGTIVPKQQEGTDKETLSPALVVKGDLLTDLAPLRCRDCAKQATCPLFYDLEEEGLDVDDPANESVDLCRLDKIIANQLVINSRDTAMHTLFEALNVKWQRLRRMIAFENMDGGMPDKAVSSELNEFISQMMYGMKPQVTVEQHFDLGQGESLLAKLFTKHSGAPVEATAIPENTKATENKVVEAEFDEDRTKPPPTY